jgi:bifunctional non-homologous end joining protein LigD
VEEQPLVSLKAYQAKRKFHQTPEPEGQVHHGQGPLHFVIQKHQASRLHFDFRLETDGTLKSWAVPKGPPLNAKEKRLAIMVEDHPLDYLHFEGTIPQGNYGAGTVMVWDTGTYHLPGITNRQQCERAVSEGLHKGKLHVVLHGKKLKGEFGLIRTKENQWLMFLAKGNTLSATGVGDEDRSVLSNRTMDEITRGVRSRKEAIANDLLDGAPKAAMPRNVKPMLATPADEPFDDPDWLFELKWDGFRAIAEVKDERVRLYSRNQLSLEKRFVPIVDSLQHLGHKAVLDGEVVVLDADGKPSFQLLQQYNKTGKGMLVYEVFDLLHLDGRDLRRLPLLRRKDILAKLIHDLPNVRCCEHIAEHGAAFFQAVSEKGLEGIVAKDERSPYREGLRSPAWLKIKTSLRQEAVIGGFTEPKGSRAGLGSLLLGVYENSGLTYIGHAGTGFSEKSLADLRARLDGLTQKTCPFTCKPKSNAPVHWVKPTLVCEVSFAEWTDDGHMRHPVFLGLREDKAASTVRREQPQPVASVVPKRQAPQSPAGQQQDKNGPGVQLTNLNKVYWPNEGYTKGDLVHYYQQVSSVILPYLKDRPESLHRHPNGIEGKSFFQKDMRQQPPPAWVQTVELTSETDGKTAQSVLCQDEATLLYLANLGCIELNPWNSRVGTLDRADYLLLDLDPEGIAFNRVVEAAQAIRKLLQQAGVESCCKTSGKRGLHVYVPLGAQYSHDQAKHFAELIARIVNRQLPDTTSLVRMPSGRQQRVYLDYLQNGKGKTLAAPYSVRPNPQATVSTPLKWTEVRRGLDPSRFTIRTVAKRLDAMGDLWKPVLGPGVDLPQALSQLAWLVNKRSL